MQPSGESFAVATSLGRERRGWWRVGLIDVDGAQAVGVGWTCLATQSDQNSRPIIINSLHPLFGLTSLRVGLA